MELSRRGFLGFTAGAIGLLSHTTVRPARTLYRWRTLGCDPESLASESIRGYRAALPEERQSPVEHCSLLIIPSVVAVAEWLRHELNDCLGRGSTVVIETGAGFAPDEAFGEHRRSLWEAFRVRVASRVDLWTDPAGPGIPYIKLTWPRRAQIRDFSRVAVVADQPGEIVAWAGDLPVGLRRRVGNGTLIYLGTPVGPALWTGDLEARRWLYALARSA